MNREQRQTYAEIQRRAQDQMANRFIGPVYTALKNQISSFKSDIRNHGLQYAKARLATHLMNLPMEKVIKDLHLQAGMYAAKKTRIAIRGVRKSGMDDLEFKRGGFGFNEQMTTDILEYFKLYLLEKAVLPISQTTKDRIETVLNEGVKEGWGVDRIIAELDGSVFREMTRTRAQTIVRTETVRASNYGALAAANQSDWEQEKIWIAINDNRTRPTHRHFLSVDGEPRDLLQPFSNGLMFPGDPEGDASETVNCRCAIAFRAKRDENGRLIPKEKPAIVRNLLVDAIRNVYRRIAIFLTM